MCNRSIISTNRLSGSIRVRAIVAEPTAESSGWKTGMVVSRGGVQSVRSITPIFFL